MIAGNSGQRRCERIRAVERNGEVRSVERVRVNRLAKGDRNAADGPVIGGTDRDQRGRRRNEVDEQIVVGRGGNIVGLIDRRHLQAVGARRAKGQQGAEIGPVH